MFDELLTTSKAQAEAGDLLTARATLQTLQSYIDNDEQNDAAAIWNDALAELESMQFVLSLDGGANDNAAAGQVARTIYEPTDVDARTQVSGPPTEAIRMAAAPTSQPACVVLVDPVADIPSASVKPKAVTAPAPVQPMTASERPVQAVEASAPLAVATSPTSTPKVLAPEKMAELAPTVAAPGGFRDSRFEALVAGGTAASEPSAVTVPPAVPSKSEPKRKAAKKGAFRTEILFLLLGVGMVAMILEPWTWGGSKGDKAAAHFDNKYPELGLREAREDTVTPDQVRARMFQEKEAPRPEFNSTLAAKAPKTAPPEITVDAPQANPSVAQVPEPEPMREMTRPARQAQATKTKGGRPGLGGKVARERETGGGQMPAMPAAVPTAMLSAAAIAANDAVPPTGEEIAVRPRRGTRYYEAPAEDAPAAKPTGPQPIGLPLNTRVRLELQIGITSTKHDAVVLARVSEAVRIGEKVVLPKGALLKGRSSNDADRVYIRFHEVVIGKEKFAVDASAVEGDLPGVKAMKREATLEERQQSRVAQGALGAAADVALRAAGVGVAGTVLRGVSSGAVEETQQAQQYETSVVLVVPARTQVDAVVFE